METAVARPSALRAYVTAGAIFAGALIAAYVFPQLDKVSNPTSTQPGLITFLGSGLALLALTALMLSVGLRGLLPKTALFVFAAFGYNALVIVVKFALGPLGLYSASTSSQGFLVLNESFSFLLVAPIMAILYAGAFFLIYLFHRSELRRRLGIPVRIETRFIVLLVVMFAGGVSGVLSIIGAYGFLEYLISLLYVIAVGLLIAVALVAAVVLCSVAFAEATAQATLMRNVAVLSTFAWIGLAFIAAYHVVWLVFVLTLVSIWPLKSMSVK